MQSLSPEAARLSAARAVVFDLDDTLFDERSYVLSGFAAVQDALLQNPFGGRAREFYSAAKARFDRGAREKMFDRVLADLGLPAGADDVSAMVRVYRSHTPKVMLLPGAQALLTDLSQAGFLLGLLTDGYEVVQRAKVAALGLASMIPCIVYSDALGREHWKPHEKPFLEMAAALGVRGDACVYIGDNPAKDFVGARKLGWRTIRIRWSSGQHAGVDPLPGFGPDIEVTSLRAVRELFRLTL